jgi:hypothetical protein
MKLPTIAKAETTVGNGGHTAATLETGVYNRATTVDNIKRRNKIENQQLAMVAAPLRKIQALWR